MPAPVTAAAARARLAKKFKALSHPNRLPPFAEIRAAHQANNARGHDCFLQTMVRARGDRIITPSMTAWPPMYGRVVSCSLTCSGIDQNLSSAGYRAQQRPLARPFAQHGRMGFGFG